MTVAELIEKLRAMPQRATVSLGEAGIDLGFPTTLALTVTAADLLEKLKDAPPGYEVDGWRLTTMDDPDSAAAVTGTVRLGEIKGDPTY